MHTADKKMTEEYIDSEKLIIEVEKRPGLYNNKLPEYSDKDGKEKLWAEVYEAIVPSWSRLEKSERIDKGNDIQRKWKNMRDSFRKEVNYQIKRKSSNGKKKRRKYIYFEELQFLLPTMQKRKTTGSQSSPLYSDGEEQDNEQGKSFESCMDVETDSNVNPKASVSIVKQSPFGHTKKRKISTYEESVPQILEESKTEDIDADKSFLLSLLPSFKQLTMQQKLMVKIEFLQVLQRVMFSQNPQNQ